MATTKTLTAKAEVIKQNNHYAVVIYQNGTPAVLAGFTWVKGLNGPIYVESEARAKALADEKASLGYCPSL